MELNDLTIIFLTANEVPEKWAEFHKNILLGYNLPVITISRKPLDWGTNILDTKPKTISNIYYQMLVGAKKATTPFVAIVEDDTLYPVGHFDFRPQEDTFAYNINRFNLFTWGHPVYFWKDRISNSTLIAPRKLMIEALSERFKKYPQGTPDRYTGELGRPLIEKRLGLIRRKIIMFESDDSIVRIDHEFGIDVLAKGHRKGLGPLKCYDIPHWGCARDLIKKFQ